MLMMCTCSRQRSLSMKYFNKKHKISKTKKAGDAKKFTLYQRPIPYNVNFLSFKIQNICHGQYLYSNQNLKSQDPSTMQTKHSVIHPSRWPNILPTSVFLHVIGMLRQQPQITWVIFWVFHLSLEKYFDIFIGKYLISRKSFKVFLQYHYTFIIVGPEFHEDHEDRL